MENPGKNFSEKLRWEFIFWLARRLPDCKTLTPMFSASLDRGLSVREKVVMKLHLFTCDSCKNYFAQIKFMREAFRVKEKHFAVNRGGGQLEPKLSPDARERLKSVLRATNDQN